MAPALNGELDGVLHDLLGLYGTGNPDAGRAGAGMQAVAADLSAQAGAGTRGYVDAQTMQLSIADSHARKDGVVGKTVGESGDGTVTGRNRLNEHIADFRTRAQAIAAVGNTRFSGPALLEAAQTTIVNATRQVDRDVAAARSQAAQIMPPAEPPARFVRRGPAARGRHRNRTRTRDRSRSRSRARTSKHASLSSDGSAGGNAVQAASEFLGTPYRWGGGGAGGPSGGGFDCSGLTQYAIAQATDGQVVLPRTTYEQIYSGDRVPYSQVQAGDLVFPADSWSSRGPEHVQLAANKHWVIEAPQPGQNIKMSPMPGEAIIVRVLPTRGSRHGDRDT